MQLDKNLQEFTKAVSKLGHSPTLWQDVDNFGHLLGHLLHLFRRMPPSYLEMTRILLLMLWSMRIHQYSGKDGVICATCCPAQIQCMTALPH